METKSEMGIWDLLGQSAVEKFSPYILSGLGNLNFFSESILLWGLGNFWGG